MRRRRSIRPTSLIFWVALGLSNLGQVPASYGTDVPKGLVLDMRLFEARSASPDFQAMEALSFFVETDGRNVTDLQWLATLATRVPDSFLASLATETARARDGEAVFELTKRSQTLVTRVGLAGFLERGTFMAPVTVRLERGDRVDREFEREIELRLDQTFVFSGYNLELSPSEYLSHLRDYESSENRSQLYNRLRESTMFLIIAITPRIESVGGAETKRVTLELADTEIPELESPYDIPVVGSILLHFDVDSAGTPQDVTIVRSSLTEVNPRILGEAVNWRFPEAAGKPARLRLELRAEPNRRPRP